MPGRNPYTATSYYPPPPRRTQTQKQPQSQQRPLYGTGAANRTSQYSKFEPHYSKFEPTSKSQSAEQDEAKARAANQYKAWQNMYGRPAQSDGRSAQNGTSRPRSPPIVPPRSVAPSRRLRQLSNLDVGPRRLQDLLQASIEVRALALQDEQDLPLMIPTETSHPPRAMRPTTMFLGAILYSPREITVDVNPRLKSLLLQRDRIYPKEKCHGRHLQRKLKIFPRILAARPMQQQVGRN